MLCIRYAFIILSQYEYHLQEMIPSQTGKGFVKVENILSLNLPWKEKVIFNVFIFKMSERFSIQTMNQGKQLSAYEQM